LKTNQIFSKKEVIQKYYENENALAARKGQQLASFKLGSTVVMIYESPRFVFSTIIGQKVKMGAVIGFVPQPRYQKLFKK